MTNIHNKILGNLGEDLAINYMRKLGFLLIAKNVHNKNSELDLIFCKKDFHIFLEVKTRLFDKNSGASEVVSKYKILKLRRGVSSYIKLHPEITHYRLDSLYISLKVSEIIHYKDITN